MGLGRRTVVGLALVLAIGVGALVVVARSSGATDPAVAAAEHFLDTYVDPDGRVVRRDQGGDTVSEGQAYGMLIAVGIGDEDRFHDIWSWTKANLRRSDGLLAWRWVDGRVVDWSSASDADLFAAGALAIAGRRFEDPALVREARAMGSAVLATETLTVGSWRVLMAGPWAVQERVVNPSYFAVPLMSWLYTVTGEHRWALTAATSRRVLEDLTTTGPRLIPDWASVGSGMSVSPRPAPGGTEVLSGYEAGRAYVQLAVDCDPRGPAIAARAWPFLESEATGTINGAYRMDGSPATTATGALPVLAAAASADSAGDHAAADELVNRAAGLHKRFPTYYGAAWMAIARLWLDTSKLGGCPPR